MLSVVILSALSYPAMPLAGQQVHHWCVHSGPLVLRTAPLNFPAPTADRDRHSVTSSLVTLLTCILQADTLLHISLHVAMQFGLYLHSKFKNVWRVVSEGFKQEIISSRIYFLLTPPLFMENAIFNNSIRPSTEP